MPHVELLQIVEDDEVGPITRRNRAVILETVMASGVDRSHLDGGDRRDAERDRFPDRMIDVPFVHEVAGQLVVGGE